MRVSTVRICCKKEEEVKGGEKRAMSSFNRSHFQKYTTARASLNF